MKGPVPKDRTGEVYGYFTVLNYDFERGQSHYICKCSCGNIRSVRADGLLNGRSKSCGCKVGEFLRNDHSGARSGKLTVLSRDGNTDFWNCRCDCGNLTRVASNNIGNIKSCGCLKKKSSYDLSGTTCGFWTFIEELPHAPNKPAKIRCKCACGTERVLTKNSYLQEQTLSCGCYKRIVIQQRQKGRFKIDLTGLRVGRLTVLRFANLQDTAKHWLCRCDCGNEKLILGSNLRAGTTLSCGCRQGIKYEQNA